tara:strand:+ start:208 stop:444 length:237 start_codon:yes stop_codon:yes gene_type:complete
MMHTFCLVIDKKEHELIASKYFMEWLKETVEFLLPQNTLTTNKDFFDMMKKSQQVSMEVNSRETAEHIIYYTKQKYEM